MSKQWQTIPRQYERQWRIQKILVGGMIRILSTKPQKFGCFVTQARSQKFAMEQLL